VQRIVDDLRRSSAFSDSRRAISPNCVRRG
jgi:hypothetical protein